MKKNKNEKKLNKKYLLLVALVLILMLPTNTAALLTPLGLDGYIYELDGLTQVRENTQMKIVNKDTNEEILLKTGFGSSGRYSVALNWPKETNIEVIAYTKENSVSRQTTLSGVIHNFNLLLNTTLPQTPPIITTTNIGSAEQLELFKKQIVAYDENNDEITFELEYGPEGMKIFSSTGLLYWTPRNNQLGEYAVSIIAKDEYAQTKKEFTIEVYETNNSNQNETDNSTKITTSTLLDAQKQTFDSSSSSRLKSSSLIEQIQITEPKSSKTKKKFEFENTLVTEITLKEEKTKNIVVKEVEKNTKKKIERLVYKYIEITPELSSNPDNLQKDTSHEKDSHNLVATIKFKVSKIWLKQKSLMPQDIQLIRFHDGEWQKLKTESLYDDGTNIVFEAETPGFSLFAITHKKDVKPNNKNERIVDIKTDKILYGVISSEKEIYGELKLELITENERLLADVQKLPEGNYLYQISIPEQIKEVRYELSQERILKKGIIKTNKEKTEKNINLESNMFTPIINTVSSLKEGKITEIASMFIIFTITAIILIFYILRKKEIIEND